MTDFEWPSREPIGGDDPKDRVTPDRSSGSIRQAGHAGLEEHNQRTQIVWLPSDESALDEFASESDLLDAPAPSRATATERPAITAAPDSRPERTIAPIRAPAIEPIRDYPIDPDQDYHIDSARNVAIEPIRQYARRGSMRAPRTSLLQRCAIFVVLALGVFGGGLAGLYLRRHPIDLAIIRIPVDDEANQPTIAVPTPETASPGANDGIGTAGVNEQPVPSAGEMPIPPGNQPPPPSPSPEAGTIPNETAAPTRTDTPVPAPPRAATENSSPPPVIVPPPPMPPARIDPLTTTGGAASTRERNDDSEVPSPSQAIPITPGAPVESSVVPLTEAEENTDE